MKRVTLTEALAELKVLNSRIDKKIRAIGPYLARPSTQVDPLIEQGGSPAHVAKESQAISDLCENIVKIRTAILACNLETSLTLNGATRSIQGWLNWRRDVVPHLNLLQRAAANILTRRGDLAPGDENPAITVNFNEQEFHARAEGLTTTLEQLDGQLSLLNATTTVGIPD